MDTVISLTWLGLGTAFIAVVIAVMAMYQNVRTQRNSEPLVFLARCLIALSILLLLLSIVIEKLFR